MKYNENNMTFPDFDEEIPEKTSSRLTHDEFGILVKILNSIKNGNYFETIMGITFADGDDAVLDRMIKKINLIYIQKKPGQAGRRGGGSINRLHG